MKKNITDQSSPEYQRMTWDALRKSINGLINKVCRSFVFFFLIFLEFSHKNNLFFPILSTENRSM